MVGLFCVVKGFDVKVFIWVGSSGWSNCVDVIEGNEEIVNGFLIVGYYEGIVFGFLEFLINFDRILEGINLGNFRNFWFDEVL